MPELPKARIVLERKTVPMIMHLSPSLIIHAINQCLVTEGRSYELIPVDATISVHVPGGGDYSNMDLELDEKDISLEIRWEGVV